MRYLSLLFLLLSCGGTKDVTYVPSLSNPFTSPQIFYVIEKITIDSVLVNYDFDYSDLLENGRCKRKAELKPDPMSNIYLHKYLCYQQEQQALPLSVYTRQVIELDSVHVYLQKRGNDSINCMVDDKPCFCIFE